MSTAHVAEVAVQIPPWVIDRAAFRRWLHSDAFPDQGRISYLLGGVMVDMSSEALYSHNRVKTEITTVLNALVDGSDLGTWFSDGILIGCAEADFTSGPDGCFVAHEALESGRVREIAGAKDQLLELEGAIDMVLEVVSDSSVQKDTVVLLDLYWQAGILEYWLIDARGDRLSFEVFRHGAKGYVSVKRQGGWVKSPVFGKGFQLTQGKNKRGKPRYSLAVK